MAQHVVDQPQAFTGPEPGIAVPQPPGSDLLRPEVRIEQPHGRVEMCQAGAPFDQLPLKTVDHPGEFGSLVAQRTDDMCLSQRRSPAERINGMDDKRRASTLGRPGGGRSYIRPAHSPGSAATAVWQRTSKPLPALSPHSSPSPASRSLSGIWRVPELLSQALSHCAVTLR